MFITLTPQVYPLASKLPASSNSSPPLTLFNCHWPGRPVWRAPRCSVGVIVCGIDRGLVAP